MCFPPSIQHRVCHYNSKEVLTKSVRRYSPSLALLRPVMDDGPDMSDMSDMSTTCEKKGKAQRKGARYEISDKIGTGRSGKGDEERRGGRWKGTGREREGNGGRVPSNFLLSRSQFHETLHNCGSPLTQCFIAQSDWLSPLMNSSDADRTFLKLVRHSLWVSFARVPWMITVTICD